MSFKSPKKLLADIIVRLIWSGIAALFMSLVASLWVRWFGITEVTLTEVLNDVILGTFPTFFMLAFPLIFTIYLVGAVGELEPPDRLVRLQKRFRKIELETRHQVSYCLKRISIGCFFIFIAIGLLGLRESFLGLSRNEPIISTLMLIFVILYFLTFILLGTSRLLMRPLDWTIYYMLKFQKAKYEQDLQHALINYNRSLEHSLSAKRVLEISQVISEAYKIGTERNLSDMNQKLHSIIESLKVQNAGPTNKNLIDLTKSAMELTKKHKEVLGFEVKYPLKLRITEHLRSSLGKIFIELVLFLLWIGVWILLAYAGVLQIPQIPPPFK